MQISPSLNQISGRFNFKDNTATFYFMDDWSDFKQVKRVQQFIKDLIRLKWINKKWKLIIQDTKSTRLNLGGTTVAKLLQYDASFTKTIPICYHGTSDYYLDDIKLKGLTPAMYTHSMGNWDKGYIDDSGKRIYLTIDYNRAKYYASFAVDKLKEEGIKSKKIIIQIKDLPISNVVADDDILTNMGQLQLLSFLHTGKTQLPNYISGIRQSSQFAYNGRIASTNITKIIN
jgi:hypothetical protein